uniref:Reverse transcriptase domain-containing protein n=1 Tax=Tanacetum cinerariifolium TaxID=118510 RepID=A0A6L2L231_TANCI|nr:hypothetical protein [Tanacetum cinerariifolium]
MPTTLSGMTPEAIEELIAQHMAEALATFEANYNIENIVESRDENESGNRGRNSNGNGNGNGNENRGGNENVNGNNNNRSGNHGENTRGAMKVVHEEEKIERYIWGLPKNIQGNVTSARTTSLQDTIRMANSLID